MSLENGQRYQIAGGTVTGRSHALSGKPNQDAFAWAARGEILAAVVCDGCGSGARSEVGAELGARIAAARIAGRLERGQAPEDPALWDGLRGDLLAALGDLATAMGGDLARAVGDCFLFTVVGLALSGDRGAVFAAGDGIAAIDGAVTRLGPFPGNEPPYLGYGLIDRGGAAGIGRGGPGFTLVGAFTGAGSVLLGTDGAADLHRLEGRRLPGGREVAPLSSFWEDDRCFQNRDAVRRRLALINREVTRPVWEDRRLAREPGLLDDDTTLVVVRRAR